MEFRQIPLPKIESDFKYACRAKTKNNELFESVKKSGILEPLWLVEDNGYIIIEGHQRVLAARAANLQTAPALVFPADRLAGVFRDGVRLNLSRGLSLPERLNALMLAEKYFDERMRGQISEILGVSRHPALPKILAYLKNAPEWLFEYLHVINIQFKNIKRLSGYPPEIYNDWLKLCAELNFKSVEVINLLEKVQDISLRDAIESRAIWDAANADEILASEMTPRQKVNLLKERLARMRSPIYYEINENVGRSVRKVERDFDGALRITWDQSMETPGLELSLRLPDAASAGRLIPLLGQKNIVDQLKETMELMEKIPEGHSDV